MAKVDTTPYPTTSFDRTMPEPLIDDDDDENFTWPGFEEDDSDFDLQPRGSFESEGTSGDKNSFFDDDDDELGDQEHEGTEGENDQDQQDASAPKESDWQEENKSKLQNIFKSRRRSVTALEEPSLSSSRSAHNLRESSNDHPAPEMPSPRRLRKTRSNEHAPDHAARPGLLRRAMSRPSLSPQNRGGVSTRRLMAKATRERSPHHHHHAHEPQQPQQSRRDRRERSLGPGDESKPRRRSVGPGEEGRSGRRSVGPDDDRRRRRSVGPDDHPNTNNRPRRRSVEPDHHHNSKHRTRSLGPGEERTKRRDRSVGPGEEKTKRRERSLGPGEEKSKRRERSPRRGSRSPATSGRSTRKKRPSVKAKVPIRRSKSMDETDARFFERMNDGAMDWPEEMAAPPPPMPRYRRTTSHGGGIKSQHNNKNSLNASSSRLHDLPRVHSERRMRSSASPPQHPKATKQQRNQMPKRKSPLKGTSLRQLMADGQKSKPKLAGFDDDLSIDDTTISWVREKPKKPEKTSPRNHVLLRKSSGGTAPAASSSSTKREELRKVLSEKHVSARSTRKLVNNSQTSADGDKSSHAAQRAKALGEEHHKLKTQIDDSHELSMSDLMSSQHKLGESTHTKNDNSINTSQHGNNSKTKLAIASLAGSLNGSFKVGQHSAKKCFSLEDSDLSLEDVIAASAATNPKPGAGNDKVQSNDDDNNQNSQSNSRTKTALENLAQLGEKSMTAEQDQDNEEAKQEDPSKPRKEKRKDAGLRASTGSQSPPLQEDEHHPLRRSKSRDDTFRASTGSSPPPSEVDQPQQHAHRRKSKHENLRASTGSSHGDHRRSRSPKHHHHHHSSSKELRSSSTGSSHQHQHRSKSSKDLRSGSSSHEDRRSSRSPNDRGGSLRASTGSSSHDERRSKSPKERGSNLRSSTGSSHGDRRSRSPKERGSSLRAST